MLIFLGFSMIAVFMYLILAKRLTPTLALVLVPLSFALVVTATGVGQPGDIGRLAKNDRARKIFR